MQPLKVLLIAMFLSLIFKKSVHEKVDQIDIDEDEYYRATYGDDGPSVTYDDLAYKPLSEKTIKEIRALRAQNKRMWMFIIDILIYVPFMTLLLLLLNHSLGTGWYATNSMKNMFINVQYEGETEFTEVSTMDDMWDYIGGTLVDNLQLKTWYNGAPCTLNIMPDMASHLIGVPRMRQLRIKKGSCVVPLPLTGLILECQGRYEWGREDTGSYSKGWTQLQNTSWTNDSCTSQSTAWSFQSAYDLHSIPLMGNLASYGGGGFVVNLSKNKSCVLSITDDLKKNNWVDKYTRAILVEFTTYNAQSNLFSIIVLMFEFADIGHVTPFHSIFTSQFYPDDNIAITVLQVIFIVLTCLYTFVVMRKLFHLGSLYIKEVFNIMDFIIIALTWSVIGLFFQRHLSVEEILKQKAVQSNETFISFYTASLWDFTFNHVLAFLSFIVILKLVKVLQFNRFTSAFPATLTMYQLPLMNILVMIMFMATAFASFANLCFGRSVDGFRHIGETYMTILGLVLGEMDFDALEGTNKALRLVAFTACVITVQYVGLTLLIATILFGFRQVHRGIDEESIRQQRADMELITYTWHKLLQTLGFKSDNPGDKNTEISKE